jgi:hypothetical protein
MLPEKAFRCGVISSPLCPGVIKSGWRKKGEEKILKNEIVQI